MSLTATPTTKELHSWTFSAGSVAPCTVHDVHNMEKNSIQDFDFFWLGRVPCRSVKIVGIIVGIQVFEKRIIYTIDDGTEVVDCIHLQLPQNLLPAAVSKYKSTDKEITLAPLIPTAEIGDTVQVSGSIRLFHNTRTITVDRIDRCHSQNEELVHSRLVLKLRRTHYNLNESFIIPDPAESPASDCPIKPDLRPPLMRDSSPLSVFSSSAKSSPIKDPNIETGSSSPPKFRHPSRLYKRDLTENTFRIYLKHFIDSVANTSGYISESLPTKRRHDNKIVSSEPMPQEGFTLSYLRRVPELSILAYRVVRAVASRLEREKTRVATSGERSSSPSKYAGKVKRLFEWAIIQLLKEGCIVLWDGPARPLPDSNSTTSHARRLWKTKPNHASKSTPEDTLSLPDDPISGYLSDPSPDEESYVSLTPDYLSEHVLVAIQFLVEIQETKRRPYAGATAANILTVLKQDDRWQYIGLWTVQDALELLQSRGTVWDMGKGKWDLTD